MKVRVLLVDDHPLFLESLRMMLETDPGIEVVGEVSDGGGVVEAIRLFSPAVVCMDINMPNCNGIEATQQLLAVHPHVKVISLSAHASLASVVVMFNAGATGYVIKSDAGKELLAAIRAVSQDQSYLSQRLGLNNIAELRRHSIRAKSN